jgi:hypothetical protein
MHASIVELNLPFYKPINRHFSRIKCPKGESFRVNKLFVPFICLYMLLVKVIPTDFTVIRRKRRTETIIYSFG